MRIHTGQETSYQIIQQFNNVPSDDNSLRNFLLAGSLSVGWLPFPFINSLKPFFYQVATHF